MTDSSNRWERVITQADSLDVCVNGEWKSHTDLWSRETRAPSEFTLAQFIETSFYRMADGDYDRVRVNGTEYTEDDLNKIVFHEIW